MIILRLVVRWLLTVLFRIKVTGLEHYQAAGDKVLIIANHTSFLDGILLSAFFPDRLVFAVNTHIARKWWARPFLSVVGVRTLDSSRPHAIRTLLRDLNEKRKVVMFPEGRITLTGTLMKTYPGTGLLADKSGAAVLPVGIDGPQYSPLSRLRGHMRLRWFPTIRLTILPPRRLALSASLRGQPRRAQATRVVADTMAEMVFATSNYRSSLFEALLEARSVYGGRCVIAEDDEREPLNYNQLIQRALSIGAMMSRYGKRGDRVGVLMPNTVTGLLAFLGLQACGRVPVMLDSASDADALLAACRVVSATAVYTARELVQTAPLTDVIGQLQSRVQIIYMEDLTPRAGRVNKLKGLVLTRLARVAYRRLSGAITPDDAAVVFPEPAPGEGCRGVVLSHANLLANCHQLRTRIDSNVRDIVINVLPMSSVYGLNVATLLSLFSGMKVFFYSAARQKRSAPEVAYEISATMLFGNEALLARFARGADPFDFHRLRYVFAAADTLTDQTRQRWQERFGLRILEGYGKSEAGPVLAINTPVEHRPGTLGRLLPGIEHRLQAAPAGTSDGGRLWVKGPNVMLGYLSPGVMPASSAGDRWFDTGESVRIDEDGFLWLLTPPRVPGRP